MFLFAAKASPDLSLDHKSFALLSHYSFKRQSHSLTNLNTTHVLHRGHFFLQV
ncbi:hypothetical protein Hanom_Chr06g00487691 [Helianthus anomalus]